MQVYFFRLEPYADWEAAGFPGTIGLLNGVRHTCNDLEDLKQRAENRCTGEAPFLPRQAVRNGRLVTANGTAALEFTRDFLLALEAALEQESPDWYLLYKPGYHTAPLPEI